VEREAPPLFGWEACGSSDGVERDFERKLGIAPQRLEYYHAFANDLKFPEDGKAPAAKPGKERGTKVHTFFNTTESLQVAILGASNLPATDGDIEPYCICEIPGKELERKIRTLSKHHSLNPEWRQKFEVDDFEKGDTLVFSVKNNEEILGQFTLGYGEIYPLGFVGDVLLDSPDGETKMEARLSLCIIPSYAEIPGITCEVNKKDGNVGIGIVPDRDRECLAIRIIAEGDIVDQWNAGHPQQPLKNGDRIVEVNGKRGACETLLMELAQSKDKLKLEVKRKLSL
jgi:hypothetical protein